MAASTRQQVGEGRLNVKKTRIICSNIDVVLEFSASSSSRSQKLAPTRYLMGVSSTALKESSMYFRVILDPDKFREGRELFEKTAQLDYKYGAGEVSMNDAATFTELPAISVELPPLAGVFDKADLIETFLKVLHFGSTKSHSVHQTQEILDHLAKKSISFVANLIVLSDRFGGQQALGQALNMPLSGVSRSVGQTLMSKTLRRLQTSQIEDEERTRQAIYFASFLGYNDGIVAFTHRLIIDGSKEWIYGGRDGWVGIDRPLWWHLPQGIEGRLVFVLFLDPFALINNPLALFFHWISTLKFLTRSHTFKRQFQMKPASATNLFSIQSQICNPTFSAPMAPFRQNPHTLPK